jgi:hypothetical protein
VLEDAETGCQKTVGEPQVYSVGYQKLLHQLKNQNPLYSILLLIENHLSSARRFTDDVFSLTASPAFVGPE